MFKELKLRISGIDKSQRKRLEKLKETHSDEIEAQVNPNLSPVVRRLRFVKWGVNKGLYSES